MTSKPRILVTRTLVPEVDARIARDYDAYGTRPGPGWTAEELVAAAHDGAEALLICTSEKMTAEVIGQLPERVRVISSYSVGVDHVDLDAARARNLPIANTPDPVTIPTAEITMLLILAAAKRASEGDALVRAGAWTGWTPTLLLGRTLSDLRLGILGMGRIGRAVADRARAFGMRVRYYNRSRLAPELEAGARYHPTPEALMADCDILSIHAPATAETDRMVNAERLGHLPKGSIIVNTARGTLVDDDALIAALQSGHVAAAGLDVFAGEPHVDPRYGTLPNVFLMPHLGTATIEARNAMGHVALDNIDATLKTGRPLYAVG